MNNHTDLLNYIAKKIGAQTYLEIGVSNGKNYIQIDCAIKIGVDSDLQSAASHKITSDEFFNKNPALFDLIFIDGLHEAKQVKRDIENAYKFLSEKGVIVVHDCNPEREDMTHIPRDAKVWCGDVYKTVSRIGGKKFTIDFDYGCCVIKKSEVSPLIFSELWPSWYMFNIKRHEFLNLVSIEEGLKIIDSWI
jgi:hypothetical protein